MDEKNNIFNYLFFSLFSLNSKAECDDPIGDGVDYTNCRFSDGQDLYANFEGANLNVSTWINGVKCGLESPGKCQNS